MNADERAEVARQFDVAPEQVERDHLISHLLAFLSQNLYDRIQFIGGKPAWQDTNTEQTLVKRGSDRSICAALKAHVLASDEAAGSRHAGGSAAGEQRRHDDQVIDGGGRKSHEGCDEQGHGHEARLRRANFTPVFDEPPRPPQTRSA